MFASGGALLLVGASCHVLQWGFTRNMKLYVQRIACSADGRIVFALSEADKRMMKSTDAGETWAVIQDGCTFGAFACTPDCQMVYAVQLGGWQKILVSRDGGLSFTDQETEVAYTRVELGKSGKVLYGLISGVYHESADSGSTWAISKKKYKAISGCGEGAPHPQDLKAKSATLGVIYKACGKEERAPKERVNTLLKSVDGGKTWVELKPSYEKPAEVLIRVPGAQPDPRIAEMEAKRNRFRLKEPLGFYSNEAREILDRQDIQDGGIPGVDFGNGPGKP